MNPVPSTHKRHLLARKLRSLRRFVRSRARFLADLDGVRSAANYFRASGKPRRPDAPVLPISFRSTKGHAIRCRAGTTDAAVIRDTFGGLYQLPPGSVKAVRQIVDLGSNIGATIVHYGHVFPESRILGVELDRGNYELCVMNTQHLGPRCRVLWGGAWTTDGQIRYRGAEKWGFQISGDAGGNTAPALSMATILGQIAAPVDFLKMDIEGAERELLKQASAWGGRVRCMKVEVHPPYTIEECVSDLIAAGFTAERDPEQDNEVIAFNARLLPDR